MARVLLGNPFPADRSCWHVGQDAQSTLDQQYHSICALTKSLGGAVGVVKHSDAVQVQSATLPWCYAWI